MTVVASVLKIALSLSEVRARLRLSLVDLLLGQRWTGRRSASTPLWSWLFARRYRARCGAERSKRKESVLVFAVGASAFADVVSETKSLGDDVGFVFVERFKSCNRGFADGSASLALITFSFPSAFSLGIGWGTCNFLRLGIALTAILFELLPFWVKGLASGTW